MKAGVVVIVAAGLVLAGCGLPMFGFMPGFGMGENQGGMAGSGPGGGFGGGFGPGMGPGMHGGLGGSGSLPADASNGQRIFETGVNIDGQRVAFAGGPNWLVMRGGGCAACHGTDGTGGFPIMPGNVVAPDIRYESLAAAEHAGDEDHVPYDDASLARAIRDGIEPNGESLAWPMPQWDLSDRDMADLIDYLKELGGDGQP